MIFDLNEGKSRLVLKFEKTGVVDMDIEQWVRNWAVREEFACYWGHNLNLEDAHRIRLHQSEFLKLIEHLNRVVKLMVLA
jgi:hypothetical protein